MYKTCLDASALYKWSKILMYLEKCWGEVTVAAWFADAVPVEFTDTLLKLRAGNDFKCDIINRRCLHHIQNALSVLFHSNAIVEVFADNS